MREALNLSWGAGMRLRGVLIHEVFNKVLCLTPSARAAFSSGRIYSHVTSDVETIQQLSWNALGLISSPLRIIGPSRDLLCRIKGSTSLGIDRLWAHHGGSTPHCCAIRVNSGLFYTGSQKGRY